MPKKKTAKTKPKTSKPKKPTKSKARKPAMVKGKTAKKPTKKKAATKRKGRVKKPAASKAAKPQSSKKKAPLNHSKAVRTECMTMWASGLSLREIARRKKVGMTTLQRWKGSHSPDNWETYRDVIIREVQDSAITGVRKEFAGMISEELDDVKRLRTLARQLIGSFATRLKSDKFKLSEAETRTLRHLAYTLSQVQQQTRRIFGLPTHRIEADSTAPPLAIFLDDDADIDDLSNKELVALLGEQLQSGSGDAG